MVKIWNMVQHGIVGIPSLKFRGYVNYTMPSTLCDVPCRMPGLRATQWAKPYRVQSRDLSNAITLSMIETYSMYMQTNDIVYLAYD